MSITKEMLKKIKDEINNDPKGMGYAGKTDAEIAELLSGTVFRQRVVVDASPSPLHRILTSLTDSPNIVTEDDVKESKK